MLPRLRNGLKGSCSNISQAQFTTTRFLFPEVRTAPSSMRFYSAMRGLLLTTAKWTFVSQKPETLGENVILSQLLFWWFVATTWIPHGGEGFSLPPTGQRWENWTLPFHPLTGQTRHNPFTSFMQLSHLPHSLSVISGPISWIIQTTPVTVTATQLHLGHYLFYICSLIFTGFTQSACSPLASRTPNLVIAPSLLLRPMGAERRERSFLKNMHTQKSASRLQQRTYVKVYRELLLKPRLLPPAKQILQKCNGSCLWRKENLSSEPLKGTYVRNAKSKFLK